MNERKSYFAGEDDFNFFGSGTLCKLLIDFDCLFKGEWKGEETILEEGVVEVFKEFRNLGYGLYLCDVPYQDEILCWLDKTFDYDFTCNDYPTRYADLCDTWTTISKLTETSLCPEGDQHCDRYVQFEGNWREVLKLIKENDVVAQTGSASVTYEDIDWNQPKEENGLYDGTGKQCYGVSYIPVEKMNEKTTAFLRTIAKPRTERAVSYTYKPIKERWYAESVYWDVNEEIASKYGVKIEIEQGSLYHRGTWLKIKVKAPYKNWKDLLKIDRQFCKDYGFDCRKELTVFDGYELPWINEKDDCIWMTCDDVDFFHDREIMESINKVSKCRRMEK